MNRRRGLAAAGGLALGLLVAALITSLADGGDPQVRLTAAGPTSSGGVAPEATTTTSTEDRLRVEAGHGRTSPPQPTGSSRDDPGVRPSTTVASGTSSSPAAPPPASTPPPTSPAGAGCPASEVRVTVTTERATYAPREAVRGATTIENRSGAACLLPTRGFVRILNAGGKDVSGFAYTTEYRVPVSAEPGKTFTTPFTWDQRECSGAACLQVPAGAYSVVADWTEGGPYAGRGSFAIGG